MLWHLSGDSTPTEMYFDRPAQIDESAFHEALDQDPTDIDLRNQYATWLENEGGRDIEARGHRFMAHHGLSPEPRPKGFSDDPESQWGWAVGDFHGNGRRLKVWGAMKSPNSFNAYWKRFKTRQEAENALHQAVYEVEKTGKRLI